MKIMILGIMTFILFYVTNWHMDNVLEQKFYDGEGNEMHIEVKTSSSEREMLDFYLTYNELNGLRNDGKYFIYYLY